MDHKKMIHHCWQESCIGQETYIPTTTIEREQLPHCTKGMDQVARVDTCISLVADDEGEWTNRMQGGRDAQTYLEKDAGGKRCPNIPGESHQEEVRPS